MLKRPRQFAVLIGRWELVTWLRPLLQGCLRHFLLIAYMCALECQLISRILFNGICRHPASAGKWMKLISTHMYEWVFTARLLHTTTCDRIIPWVIAISYLWSSARWLAALVHGFQIRRKSQQINWATQIVWRLYFLHLPFAAKAPSQGNYQIHHPLIQSNIKILRLSFSLPTKRRSHF